MSRKKILASLIISSFALTACDSEDLPIKENDNFSYSRLQFNPTGGQLPKPNDLLFSGTTDGTLQLPDEIKAVAASGAATTYADNTIGIGALDGWSTTHPLVMDVDLLAGRTILSAPDTKFLPANAVRIFPVSLAGALSTNTDPTKLVTCNKAATTQTICDIDPDGRYAATGKELKYGVDFIVKVTDDDQKDKDGKGTIAVVWLKPLPAKSSFLYAFTDAIKDSSGRTIKGSKTYEFVKKDQATLPVGEAGKSTRNLQGLMNNYDSELAKVSATPNGDPTAAAGKLDPKNVTFTGVFTTQSTLDVIDTLKSAMFAGNAGNPAFADYKPGLPAALAFTNAQAKAGAAAAVPPSPFAKVNTSIELPYYLETASISSYWKAKGDSPLTLLGAVQAGKITSDQLNAACGKTAVEAAANPASLVGCNALDADKFNHLTRFNPLVTPVEFGGKKTKAIDVQITLPASGAFSPPYPVNISLHGLGTLKETTLATAAAFAAQGIATIAIDMPLHGSRGANLDADAEYEISATDAAGAKRLKAAGIPIDDTKFVNGTPLAFINVNSGLTVRDNFRQAIADLLALRLSIGKFKDSADTVLFDPSKVTMHGLSLGAITGTTFAAHANATTMVDSNGDGSKNLDIKPFFALNNISLVAPTGGLAWVFNESPTFGPLLMDKLVAIVAKDQGIPFALPTDPAQLSAARQSAGYKALEVAADAKVVPSLLFSVQTQVDSIDPINMAETLRTNSNNQLHLIEVVGDGFNGNIQSTNAEGLPAYDLNATNKSDQVLPNFGSVPVTGTERLIANLGLVNAAGKCINSAGLNPNGGVVRFKKGHHSSLISPASAAGATTAEALAATTEMQKQVVSFAAGSLGVTDLSVVEGTCL